MSDREASPTFSHSAKGTSNQWMMTGVVLASPSTGEIKAVMPIFNSYSDIRIENVISFDSISIPPEENYHPSAHKEGLMAPKDGAILNLDDTVRKAEGLPAAPQKYTWREIMSKTMDLDVQHLAVMVGLSSLVGAITNIGFRVVSGADAPQTLILAVAFIGFLGGRFLSEKLRNHNNE